MKLLLILVGFFACMSVERVGFRKWSFVLRPGVLFLLVMVALICTGCRKEGLDDIRRGQQISAREYNKMPNEITVFRDSETGCEYAGTGNRGVTPRMDADGKQICRQPAP